MPDRLHLSVRDEEPGAGGREKGKKAKAREERHRAGTLRGKEAKWMTRNNEGTPSSIHTPHPATHSNLDLLAEHITSPAKRVLTPCYAAKTRNLPSLSIGARSQDSMTHLAETFPISAAADGDTESPRSKITRY